MYIDTNTTISISEVDQNQNISEDKLIESSNKLIKRNKKIYEELAK